MASQSASKRPRWFINQHLASLTRSPPLQRRSKIASGKQVQLPWNTVFHLIYKSFLRQLVWKWFSLLAYRWKHIVKSRAHWWWSQCQDCQSYVVVFGIGMGSGSTQSLVYRAVVLPTLLYACKTWTVYQRYAKRLNHFHTSCLRKLLKIKWKTLF